MSKTRKPYTLKEVKPRIFHLKFERQYDLCMHFLRFREFYESPSYKFRNKSFDILDLMEYYATKFGNGVFSYTKDYTGFNLPGHVFPDAAVVADNFSQYDKRMMDVYRICRKQCGDENFCLIGTFGDDEALDHEITHGFFYLNPIYKKEATKLVKALDPIIRKEIFKNLKKCGYASKVHVDECQAYLATGLSSDFEFDKETKKAIAVAMKPFKKLFRKFNV